ncbi:MAG: TonB-dependent receptor, partial [Bacteroidota bacterium]
ESTWSAQLQAFYNNIDNQIQLFAYSLEDEEIRPDPSSLRFTYFNIAQTRLLGTTFRLNYAWNGWQLGTGWASTAYAVRYAEDVADFSDFTFANEWNMRLQYHHQATKTQAALFVRHNDQFVNYYPDSQDGRNIVGEQIQEGFTMLDATIAQRLWHNRIHLTLGVRNLLDVQQVNLTGGGGGNIGHSSGNALNIGVGRSFFAQFSYNFGGDNYKKPRRSALRLHQIDDEWYKTWLEEKGDAASRMQYAIWKGKKWSSPKVFSTADARWVTNEVDAPQLAKFPNSNTLVRTWMKGSSRFNPYDQDLFIELSDNGGKTWYKQFSPYRRTEEVSAFYGNCRLLPLSNGRMLAIWLDGRDTKYEHKTNGRMLPKPGSHYSLRSLEFDEEGRFYELDVVDEKILGLCPFDAIVTSEGIVNVYRDENNDININRYENGQWGTPKTLTNENWYLPNTIEAPAADAQEEQVAIAWYTNPRNRAQVKLSFSDDGGRTFTRATRVDEGKPIGKVDVIWKDAATVTAAWVEQREAAAQIVVANYTFYGQLVSKQYIDVPLDRAAAAIQLAEVDARVFLSYKPVHQDKAIVHWVE